jgi:plastocyanin
MFEFMKVKAGVFDATLTGLVRFYEQTQGRIARRFNPGLNDETPLAFLGSRLKAGLHAASVLAVVFFTSSSQGGTLFGVVKAQPKPELAQAAGGGGKYDSRKYKFVETIKYDEIKDFVVYIDGPMPVKTPTKPLEAEVVTQRDATFTPHVMPVLVGTKITWPNNDDIFHNVFSISDAKTFDLGLYKHPELKSEIFDKAGRVDVFCSIHTKMSCVILVLENPFYAATNGKGEYRITGIPPGTYKVKAWHERLPGQMREIVIPEEGDVRADFTVGVVNLPKQ